MGICAANMKECNKKAKCLFGPNEGEAYNPKDPCGCITGSLFDSDSCDCIVRSGYYRWRYQSVKVNDTLVNYDTNCVFQSVNQDSGLTFTGTPVTGTSGFVDNFKFYVFKYENAGLCNFPSSSDQWYRVMYITKTVNGVEEFADQSQVPVREFRCCQGIGPQLFTVRLQVWFNETQVPDIAVNDDLIFDNVDDYEAGQVSPDNIGNAPSDPHPSVLDPNL